MSASEFVLDKLAVLLTHLGLRECFAKGVQRCRNAHQGDAEVAHFHFDCVEEPDGAHGPAPFFTSHNKYLGSFVCLLVDMWLPMCKGRTEIPLTRRTT